MESLIRDLRYASRRLLKKPVFTGTAIVSLAVGIGANTAIFSIANAVILRDLPLENPAELVDVYRNVEGFSHSPLSFPDIEDLRRETTDVFRGVAGARMSFIQADIEGGVEMIPAELVSGSYFPLLGVTAHLGRTILPEDDVAPGGHYVAMLDYSYWQRRYGGDPSIVGQEIRLNGRAYSVVGVGPEAYTGNLPGLAPQVYASTMMVGHLNPSSTDELQARNNQSTFAKARLLPGVTLVQASGVTDRLASSLREQYPDAWQADAEFTLVATDDVIMNPMIDRILLPAATLMMTVVGLVLLIACANLASFLLAQAADRKKEVAIRLAMGARRSTLIRQLLTESVLLTSAGGAAGVLLASVMLKTLVAADLPLPFPITLDLSLNLTVLTFSIVLTMVAGVLFGLAPALQASRADVASTLKNEAAGGGRPRRITLRSALVVTQVAVSLMLLIGAGLFLRSLQARTAIDPGFGDAAAAIVTVQTAPDRYSEAEARVFFRSLVDEAAQLAGVTAVSMSGDLNLNPMNNRTMGVEVDGVEPPPGQDYHTVDWANVDAGFFEAVGIPILEGRNFEDTDAADAPNVVIVSEAMALRFFPEGTAVGRAFRRNETEYAVVGLARDAKVRSLGETPRPFIYRPFAQSFSTAMTVVARTSADAEATTLAFVAMARRLDPELMIFEAKTMERHLAVSLLPHRLSAVLVSAFGVLALLLASIGLFGVVSYAVSTRSREVGIRVSLGAQPGTVVRMLTKDGIRLVAVGGLIGLVLSFLGAQLLGSLLFGITTTDPTVFGAVPCVLAAVAFVAAWIPARRAGRLDPVRALKAE